MENSKERFEQLGTKIDPAMAKVLDQVCNVLQVDVYHLLQWFAYTLIKASSPLHELDPRIRKIMTMLESDVGWQSAFNLANPDELRVAQVVLILEQRDHRGFGAVMVDKPFFDEATQTECVDIILERVCEVTMRGIYRRLRQMGRKIDCTNLSDVLLTMLDAQDLLNATEADAAEGPQMGDVAPNGRQYVYGKKTKAKQRRTPDSVATDQRIKFDEYDRELAEEEARRC